MRKMAFLLAALGVAVGISGLTLWSGLGLFKRFRSYIIDNE